MGNNGEQMFVLTTEESYNRGKYGKGTLPGWHQTTKPHHSTCSVHTKHQTEQGVPVRLHHCCKGCQPRCRGTLVHLDWLNPSSLDTVRCRGTQTIQLTTKNDTLVKQPILVAEWQPQRQQGAHNACNHSMQMASHRHICSCVAPPPTEQ